MIFNGRMAIVSFYRNETEAKGFIHALFLVWAIAAAAMIYEASHLKCRESASSVLCRFSLQQPIIKCIMPAVTAASALSAANQKARPEMAPLSKAHTANFGRVARSRDIVINTARRSKPIKPS